MRAKILSIALFILALGTNAFVVPQPKCVSRDISLQASSSNQQPISRRNALLTSSSVAASILGITSLPNQADAATSVNVAEWPSLEYLEPIYEFKLSVDALQRGSKDKAKWPFLKKRLDKFFAGGLLSEKYYYSGLSFQYMSKIRYSDSELKAFINIDQNERYEAMESTMDALKSLKNNLSKDAADKVTSDADAAKSAIGRWFALVPEKDVQAVEKLFLAVRKADKDRNGRLSDEELATLSEADRKVWKKRVDLVGE